MSSNSSSTSTQTTRTDQHDQDVVAEEAPAFGGKENDFEFTYTNEMGDEVTEILGGAGDITKESVKGALKLAETSLNKYADIKAQTTDLQGAIEFIKPILVTVAVVALFYFGSKSNFLKGN